MDRGRLAIITLDSGKPFAERIIKEINKLYKYEEKPYTCELIDSKEVKFANGEVKTVINESVRGCDVFIIQLIDDPHSPQSINDNIMALATAINATKYADAARITAVIPQYPYSRQDKKSGREPITSRIFGNLLEVSGADKVITLDIHSEAIEGFFDHMQIENLHVGRMLSGYIQKNFNTKNMMVVAPDVGSAKRCLYFAKKLNMDMAIIEKVRDYGKTSTISGMRLVGDVKDKDVFINDDMLATGGTLLNACRLLKKEGAKDIYISVSLPFFSDHAYVEFDKAYKEGVFKNIIGTDAVFWGPDFSKKHPWYIELSSAKFFAKIMFALNQRRSLSKILL